MKYLIIATLLLLPVTTFAQETIVKVDAYSAEITTVTKKNVTLNQLKKELSREKETLRNYKDNLETLKAIIAEQQELIDKIQAKITEYVNQGIIEQ